MLSNHLQKKKKNQGGDKPNVTITEFKLVMVFTEQQEFAEEILSEGY